MENKTVNITEEEATAIISTLKEIKVRGFDSMDRLVGLVMFFENKLQQHSDPSKQMAEVVNNGIS